MIAAIYARKSTEQTGVADEQKSVSRQVEHARAGMRARTRCGGEPLHPDHPLPEDAPSVHRSIPRRAWGSHRVTMPFWNVCRF